MDDIFVFKHKTLLERLQEYSSILANSNVKPSEVQKEWGNFLDVAVEPTGWQAVWKPVRASCDVLKLRYPISIFGTVNQVYYDEMTANFKIEQVEDFGEGTDQIQLPETYDVSLTELFPTKLQENNALNIERTAESIDSLRFFYSHIWRSWDAECEDINWTQYLQKRIKFYCDLISKKMSQRLRIHINNLLDEANYCWKRKELIEEEMDENDVSSNNVKELMQLHFRLKMIKNDLDLLENEDIREVFESLKFGTGDDGCDSTRRLSFDFNVKENDVKNRTFIICPTQTFGELASFISQLKVEEKSLVTSHHSLAEVFETCSNVKQIYLAPGTHNLNFNENLVGKCSIVGTNKQSILTSKNFETTLLTLNGSFVFENLAFDCKTSNIGLVIADGEARLRNCIFYGNCESSIQDGIIVMAKATLILENCEFVNFSTAIQTTKNSTIALKNVLVKDCNVGIVVDSSIDTNSFRALQSGKFSSTFESLKFNNVDFINCKACITSSVTGGNNNEDSDVEQNMGSEAENDSSVICIDD